MSAPNANFQIPFADQFSDTTPQVEVDSARQEIDRLENAFSTVLNETLGRSAEHIERQRRALAMGQEILDLRDKAVKKALESNRSAGLRDVFRELIKGQFDPTLLGLTSIDEAKVRSEIIRELLDREGELSRRFMETPVPKHGGRRIFFMSPTHPNEWFMHDEKPTGEFQTIRYILSEAEVAMRSKNGEGYQYVQPQEFSHLMQAIEFYHELVASQLYGRWDRSAYDLAA